MAFCTIGVKKQKGGNVGSSSRHNDRERETPNADPERTPLNRVLIGDDRNARERVREIIEEHGGKPRKDSVEAVKLLLSASHEYFVGPDGEIDPERVERWVEKEMEFLRDRGNCGICAKAVLHLDERTPHIHAHMVPITEKGRLSATHFLDGAEKVQELHTRHAAYMRELGLERGRLGSRATHQRVKQFYASVDRDPELKIEPDRIPDPGRLKVMTAEGARGYKLEVLRHVLEQIKGPIQILQDQSQLTRDERAHRVEADKRAAEAERLAAEWVAAAEREAEERIAAVRREEAERFENLRKSALQLLEEHREQHREKEGLRRERDKLQESLKEMKREKLDFQVQAKEYSDRLTDIPMKEVMEHLGYEGESHKGVLVYRGEQNEVAMLIHRQKAYDGRRELICRNSLDLVVFMKQVNEGQADFDRNDALAWLQDEFGDKRAHGAYLANREQSALEFFGRRNEER
ncbi:MAG: plasmid recombination protein, partial [Acidobacteriota bacterium]|nr:plasmid recombination protein [Acidobacteriota bacterium]